MMTQRIQKSIVTLLFLFLITPYLEAQVTECASEGTQDGFAINDNACVIPTTPWCEGTPAPNSIRAGDRNDDREMEGFSGIDVSGFGGPVTSAALCLYYYGESGDPSSLDPFSIYAVDFGPTLTAADFNTSTIMLIDTFSYMGNTAYCFDVTAAVNDAINNVKSWSLNGSSYWFQFTIRANGSVNGVADRLMFSSVEGGTPPCITYYQGACPAVTVNDPSPLSGCVGDTIILTGSGFWTNQLTGTVDFNGTAVATYNTWYDTQIEVLVPNTATTGPPDTGDQLLREL